MAQNNDSDAETVEMAGTDRERGVITQNDREWLAGEREYSSQATVYNVRSRIKDRIRNSTLDYAYVDLLDDGDRDEIFEIETGESVTPRSITLDDPVGRGSLDAIGFYADALRDAGIPPEEYLARALERGIDDVDQARVAVDLRTEDGEVVRTFDVVDGELSHHTLGSGILAAPEPEDESTEGEEKSWKKVVSLLGGAIQDALAGMGIVVLFLIGWQMIQEHGAFVTGLSFGLVYIMYKTIQKLQDSNIPSKIVKTRSKSKPDQDGDPA